MLLVIDIGNTCITVGLYKKDKLINVLSVPHNMEASVVSTILSSVCRSFSPASCIISSVVTELTENVQTTVFNKYKIKPVILTSNFNIDINLKVNHPKTIGADRLANIYAASKLYSARPLIIVDSGSATTFDVLDKDGSFIGGVIIPGFEMQFKALHEHTSKLPLINMDTLQNASDIICDATENEMISGIVRGHICGIEGLLTICKKELGVKPFVVITGGGAGFIQKYMSKNLYDIVNRYLTLEGIRLLYERNLN